MGAYWHVSLPLQVCINNNEKSITAFQTKYGEDYKLKANEKSSKEIIMSNGFRYIKSIDKNVYALDNNVFMKEFKAFYKELIETYIALFQEYQMPSILYKDNCRSGLFEGLDKLDLISIDAASEKLKKFSDKDGEYFASYSGWVPQMVVYEGYPLEIDGDSSVMEFMTFFYSYFKIGEYQKEFDQLSSFVETVCKTLCNKYRLARYLALPGF